MSLFVVNCQQTTPELALVIAISEINKIKDD
jgi:hypothetical protein